MTPKPTAIIVAAALVLGIATVSFAVADGRKGGPRIELTQMDTDGDGAVSPQEVTAFHDARFVAADTDGSGSLTADELLAQAAARFDGPVPDRVAARIARMIARHDTDGDGALGKTERDHTARVARLFERLDTDGSGDLSAAEMEAAKTRSRPAPPADDGAGKT